MDEVVQLGYFGEPFYFWSMSTCINSSCAIFTASGDRGLGRMVLFLGMLQAHHDGVMRGGMEWGIWV